MQLDVMDYDFSRNVKTIVVARIGLGDFEAHVTLRQSFRGEAWELSAAFGKFTFAKQFKSPWLSKAVAART